MPNRCVVKHCSQTAYYVIPSIVTGQDPFTEEITERRKREWLRQIGRKDLTMTNIRSWHRVCSRHFVTGKQLNVVKLHMNYLFHCVFRWYLKSFGILLV